MIITRIAAALFIVASVSTLAVAASQQPTVSSGVSIDQVAGLDRHDLGLRFPMMSGAELDRLIFAIADQRSMDLLQQSNAAARSAADRLLFAAADRHSMELLERNGVIVQAAR